MQKKAVTSQRRWVLGVILLAGLAFAQASVAQLPAKKCSTVFANCGQCGVQEDGSTVVCSQCSSGYGPNNGACTACAPIDPQCVACSQGVCTACTPGHGTTLKGGCVLCSQIDKACTACANDSCTACASGYGMLGRGCQKCSSIDPNCTACSQGTCTACGNGYAATRAGLCVQPGTPSCVRNVSGQCCRCPAGQDYLDIGEGRCIGPPGGSTCEGDARQ